MTTYRDFQAERPGTPPWLKGKWGKRWSQAFGFLKDVLIEGMRYAVRSRFVAIAPEDALPAAGRDRDLERVLGEAVEAYRARLLAAWEAYAWAGTKKSIVDALALAGCPNVRVLENHEFSGRDVNPAKWWRFQVFVYHPHPFGDGAGIPRWGAGALYGDGTTYAGIDHARRDLISRLIRKWKPLHATCIRVSVVLDGALWGDGTWGDGSTFDAGVVLHFVP